MSTETDWYVYRDQNRWGPYTWQQMLEMAQRGNILPSDYLWHSQYPNKIVANQVQGLFGASTLDNSGASFAHQSNHKEINCPNCSQSDKVLPAVSARIPAPIKPSDTPRTFVKVIRWIFGGAFGLVLTMLCVLIAGLTLLSGAASSQDSTGILSLLFGASLLPILCVFPLLLLFGGGVTIGLPWLIYRYVNNSYQQKFSLWQRATNKYNHLLYCTRCAGVFIEGQNRIVPIEQMQSFLYEMQDFQSTSLGGW